MTIILYWKQHYLFVLLLCASGGLYTSYLLFLITKGFNHQNSFSFSGDRNGDTEYMRIANNASSNIQQLTRKSKYDNWISFPMMVVQVSIWYYITWKNLWNWKCMRRKAILAWFFYMHIRSWSQLLTFFDQSAYGF